MRRLAESRRVVFSLALVPVTLGATALGLVGLDRLPGLLLDQPPQTTRLQSLEEARRRMPRGILLPAYFPEALAWPPSRVVGRTRWPEMLLLVFDSRQTRGAALMLCQSWSWHGCTPRLLPPLEVFHEVEAQVGARPARLSAGRTASGEVWEQVSFDWDGREVTLRLRGRTLELLRMAESLREARP